MGSHPMRTLGLERMAVTTGQEPESNTRLGITGIKMQTFTSDDLFLPFPLEVCILIVGA